jgi:hypothetical protein
LYVSIFIFNLLLFFIHTSFHLFHSVILLSLKFMLRRSLFLINCTLSEADVSTVSPELARAFLDLIARMLLF